jgi:CheY-like chemotaxis protein
VSFVLDSDGTPRRFRMSFARQADGALAGLCQDVTAFAVEADGPTNSTEDEPPPGAVLSHVVDQLKDAEGDGPTDPEEAAELQRAVKGLIAKPAPPDEGPAPDVAMKAVLPTPDAQQTAEPVATAPADRPAPAEEPPASVLEQEAPSPDLAPPLPPGSLPEATEHSLPAPTFERSAETRLTAGGVTPRALVVDDDPSVRATVVAMLADIGLRALEASEGAEALAKLRRTPSISLVVSDVVMEGVGGPEFVAEAFLERPDLRAILTSGFDLTTLLADVDLPPGIELMPKPFTRAEFVHKVEMLLAPAAAA